MKIDRAHFLLLATTLSTVACTKVSDDGGPDGGAGSGGSGGGGAGGSGGTAGATGGTAGATGGTAGATGGTAGADGGGGSAGAGGSDAGTCDDSVGTPGDCSSLSSTSCWSWGVSLCDGMKTNAKPKVAAAAVTCMKGLPDTNCSGKSPYECAKEALAAACSDKSADADCAKYVADCASADPITGAQCHQMIDGLNATGRAAVAKSMGSNCYTGYGLWSAIESF